MKTASAKAKGRKLQQLVRDQLRLILKSFDSTIVDDDVESRGMGQNGVDVILSPAAKRILPLDIECKAQEACNVTTEFWDHFGKYKSKPTVKLLIHRRNHTEALVTIRWEDFVKFLEGSDVRSIATTQS